MRYVVAIVAVTALFVLSGCVSNPVSIGAQEVNPEFAKSPERLLAQIDKIHKGMDEADVYRALGLKEKQPNLTFLDAVGVQAAMCGSCRFDPKSLSELREHEEILSRRVGRRFVITAVDKHVFIRGTSVVETKKGVDMGIVMVFENKKLILMRPDGNPYLETSESATIFGLIYNSLVKSGLAGLILVR